ncbi:MAG: AsmA family protein [Desulfovibrionaceae bacterium]|nr:AsmA family protein [Desulfovibrionaceae bacterium]
MKRALLWTLGIIMALVAVGAFALTRIDTRFVVDQIAEATASATGKALVFAEAPGLSLLPLGVTFGQAHWGDINDGQGLAVALKGGMAELELMPLFSGKIVLREIRLDEPVLEIRPPSAAPAPQVAPKTAETDKTTGENSAARQAPSDALPVELKHLRITQGRLHYVDADGASLSVSGLDISIDNLRRREEASLKGNLTFDLRLDGKNPTLPTLGGTLQVAALLRYYAPHLTFREVQLALSPATGLIPVEAGPIQLRGEGALDLQSLALRLGSASLSLPQASLRLEGQGTLTPPAFTGKLALEGSPRKLAALCNVHLKAHAKDMLQCNGAVEWAENSLHLRQLSLQLDDIPAKADLSLRPGSPLGITLALQAGSIRLDDYLPLPAQKTVAAAATGTPHEKNASPRQENQEGQGNQGNQKKQGSRTALPDLNIRAAISSISYGKLALKDIACILKGQNGQYTLSTFGANLGSGGSIKASGTADPTAESYSLKANASAVQLGPLLEALEQSRAVEGTAALDMTLQTRGSDAAAMQQNLNGSGLLEGQNIQIRALAALPASLPGLSGKHLAIPDRFDTARAPFTIHKGEIVAQPVSVTANGFNLMGQARISLPRQHLDAAARVRTLGMSIPLIAQGPFSNISFGIDPKFALDMARKLPAALLEAGKDAGSTAREGTQGAAGNAGSALKKGLEGAEGLVRGLFGK